MTVLIASCLTISWFQDENGCWTARSENHPRWSYKTDPYPVGELYSVEDRKACETSLKRRATKSLSFAHNFAHHIPHVEEKKA